jgi:hypothetical protein
MNFAKFFDGPDKRNDGGIGKQPEMSALGRSDIRALSENCGAPHPISRMRAPLIRGRAAIVRFYQTAYTPPGFAYHSGRQLA